MGVGAEEGPELLGLHRGLLPPWSPLDDAASRSTSRITMLIVMAAIDLGVGLLRILLSFVCLLRDDHTLLVATPPLRLRERLMMMIMMLVNLLLLGGIGIGLPLQGVHLIVQSCHNFGVRARCVPGRLCSGWVYKGRAVMATISVELSQGMMRDDIEGSCSGDSECEPKTGECELKTGECEPTISRCGLARGLLLYRCSTALPMYRCGAWGLATPL